tara:strand:- start:45 stop:383 length:339 start_codon:yes stop_codon:yes gene_type:complete
MSTEKVFRARFAGKCQKCDKKIFVGDDIVAWKSSSSMDDISSIIGKYNAVDVKKFLPRQTCWCHALCNKNSTVPLVEKRKSKPPRRWGEESQDTTRYHHVDLRTRAARCEHT